MLSALIQRATCQTTLRGFPTHFRNSAHSPTNSHKMAHQLTNYHTTTQRASPSAAPVSPPQHFDAALFQQNLKTKVLGRMLTYRASVESTMDVLQKEADEGAPTGTLVLAETQTKGRGRAARPWSSPVGNLYFSLLLRPKAVTELPKVNFAVPVAIAQACRAIDVNANVKWPNDIWVGEKKMAGVLVDSSFMGKNIHTIVGCGVNVNQDMLADASPEVREVATSIFNTLGKQVSREQVLALILNHLEPLLDFNMNEVLEIYKRYDMLVGKDIIVMPKKKEDPTRQEAKAIGFTEEGLLEALFADGQVRALLAEEVSIRPSNM